MLITEKRRIVENVTDEKQLNSIFLKVKVLLCYGQDYDDTDESVILGFNQRGPHNMLDIIEAHRFLYQFIKHQIPISELEQWFYCHYELEKLLEKNEYFDFVSRDYISKYSFHETEKQIRNLIDPGLFEQERILRLLNSISQNDNESLGIMDTLYDDYCEGFTFLMYIALYFITTNEEYIAVLKNDQTKLQQYLVPIKVEAKRLLILFKNDKLSIIGENDYFDARIEADRIELHSINEMLAANKKEP